MKTIAAPGKSTQRPELDALLALLRDGDTLVASSNVLYEQPLEIHLSIIDQRGSP
jgi:hypothetical protein